MKTPAECATLQDIRAEIDRIDRQIVAALGDRYAYVKAASQFKTSAESVKAPERLQAMLQERRQWAEQEGLNPDAIAQLFHDLIQHFIVEEMQQWRSQTEK